ncbi:MAG: transcriptional repressor [Candidatus Aminicenantes bacterium]|nr:transcriptional repressor [Candidatus Aminicenantes bacterium]NIM83370.1 transcriptional repressor [Candidatus Aminicenantes bacterium]NIN22734.1 transcriptional repressor [Candidatus Aminicenantes bacterium]NIN46494.1 transcriptional repressor [Candidatus Aminicenantes bacterium]NIN89376.1 transcriptional repressor [Candidatus Aminicenantes bacterium]
MSETGAISIDKIRGFLESKGVKPSFQRLKILEYLLKHRNHPSVDTIFQALGDDIPTLSKTTVYNTLSLFTQKGIVASLTVVNNELRYDVLKDPHAHFQCAICSRLYDIPLKNDLFQTDFIEDHQVEDIQVTFKGVCKNCLKSRNVLDKTS